MVFLNNTLIFFFFFFFFWNVPSFHRRHSILSIKTEHYFITSTWTDNLMLSETQYRNFLSGCLVGTTWLVEKLFCLYSNPSCFQKPATSNRHTVVFSFDDLQDPACCRIFANSICAQDQQTPIGVHAELIHCTPRTQSIICKCISQDSGNLNNTDICYITIYLIIQYIILIHRFGKVP